MAEFEELPADEVTNAKDRKRQAKERLKNEVKQLKADGLLLDRKLSRPAQAFAVLGLRSTSWPGPNGARMSPCVSTGRSAKLRRRFPSRPPRHLEDCERRRGPTGGDQRSQDAWGLRRRCRGRHCCGTRPLGTPLLKTSRRKTSSPCPGNTSVTFPLPKVSADSPFRPTAGSWLIRPVRRSIITDVATGRPLLEIPDHSFEHATFHPSGEWLALGHPACDLISLNTEPHWRRVVDLPKRGATWPLAQVANLSNADIEDIIEQGRRFPVLGTYAAGFSRDGRWYWRGAVGGLFVYEWSAIGLAERAGRCRKRPGNSPCLHPASNPSRSSTPSHRSRMRRRSSLAE